MGQEYIDKLIETLLKERGIGEAERDAFFSPDWERDTHSPFLLSGMKKAVLRIEKALKNKETIAIYADFDADGIPGAVVLHDFFKQIGHTQVEVYIPHRNTEGFGVHSAALEKLHDKNVSLVITVDCGIRAVEAVRDANERGLDVIVTDHHLSGEELPPAYAIINPNVPDDPYPFKDLCGAAVAFKLVQALLEHGDYAVPLGWEKWLLDMVGIATLSDMVPLVGENRVLAYYGLLVLRKTRRPGLIELFRKAGVSQNYLTEDDVVFSVTPRINAASRMDSPEAAFSALTADREDAAERVKHLDRINTKRKGAVAQMIKEIRGRMRDGINEMKVLVLGNTHWQPGLLGLAAQRIAEEQGKPVFLWGKGDAQTIKGSARSGGAVFLNELMAQVGDLFTAYGGHKHSGGFSIGHEEIHALPQALNDAFDTVDSKEEQEGKEKPSTLLPEQVSWELYDALRTLAPFGKGNPKPYFLFENISPEKVETFGKVGTHLKISIPIKTGTTLEGIRFFASKEDVARAERGELTCVGALDVGGFGARRVRIKLEELC